MWDTMPRPDRLRCLIVLAASAWPAWAGTATAEPISAFGAAAALIDRAGCIDCHNPDGVASDTSLVFPGPGASPKLAQQFGDDLLDLINPQDIEKSRLLRKPTRRMEHAGGMKVIPGSADERILRAWVTELGRSPQIKNAIALLRFFEQTTGLAVDPSVLRRLSASQYNNTVRDLLGDVTAPARQFPPEDFVDGFKNQFMAQAASPVLTEAINAAAQQLADNAIRAVKNGDPHHLLPCRPPQLQKNRCAERFVASFGRRAFRRPMSPSELDRYKNLLAQQKDPLAGVRIVIETMLQSPHFLYQREGTDVVSRRYARASRLSFFLWNTMPDDHLMDRAARGDLDAADGTESVAQDMLNDPRARQAMDEFTEQWLRFDRIASAVKDRRSHPEYTREVQVAMAEETRRFVADLIWNDKDFSTAFTARYSFVNAELAALYKLPPPTEEFAQVPYPKDSLRSGLLGQGLFLASTGKPSDTSPTGRGLFVREHFLCQTVPPPPPGVSVELPARGPGGRPITNRERLRIHTASESCGGCHNLIDPIGLGFENFDTTGRQRATQSATSDEKTKMTVALPLDIKGQIAGIANGSFSDPIEIGKLLASNTQSQMCVAKHLFRYALGRHEGSADRLAIQKSFAAFKASGFRFRSLVLAMVRTNEFPENAVHAELSQ